MRKQLCATLAAVLTAVPAAAQTPDTSAVCTVALGAADFTSPSADMARILDLRAAESSRSLFLRRVSDRNVLHVCAQPEALQELARSLALGPLPARGAAVLPVDLKLIFNTDYPRNWHDGALRGGVGPSSSITAGAVLHWGPVEAAIAPVLAADGNGTFIYESYPDPAHSSFAHRWHGRFIDLPQRFGHDRSVRISPGQSYLRLQGRGLRTGISTENLSWGPARRNPLLLSGTAAGFPHFFVETARAHDIGVGRAEFQAFWGRLSESDYFDFDDDNDHRALTGAFAVLEPRGLDGLYLGLAHLHMQTWAPGTPTRDVLWGAYTGIDPDSAGLPRDLRLVGVFMRWAGAPGGLEVYGEWARQDSWRNWVRLFNPIDAAQAYTLGVQRVLRRGETAVRLSAEISHLSDALAHRDVGRGMQTYYVSPHVPHGHTHQGQLLGAPIGPGSEAQFLGADVFWFSGRSSFSIERVRYDDDAYYAVWAQVHGPHGHDTELSFRFGHLLTASSFSLEAELGYSMRYSRSFLGLHHGNFAGFPYRKDNNIGLRLTGRWRPPAWSAGW